MAVRSKKPRTPEAAAIRYATDLKGWDYEDLATEMRRITGDPSWTKERFDRIAVGRRQVKTEELAPLSKALGIPIQFLVQGPEGADLIQGVFTARYMPLLDSAAAA